MQARLHSRPCEILTRRMNRRVSLEIHTLKSPRNQNNGHRNLMGWSPLPETASKCQSGVNTIPLSERSDRDEDYDSRHRSGKAGNCATCKSLEFLSHRRMYGLMKPVVPSTVPYPDMQSRQQLGVKLWGQRSRRISGTLSREAKRNLPAHRRRGARDEWVRPTYVNFR